MQAPLRAAFVLIAAVSIGIGIAATPSRASDESKALEDRVKKLEKKIGKLEAKLANVKVVEDSINGLAGPHVIFEGCNVHVRSGSGDTEDGGTPSGLGNLIVGYNEPTTGTDLGRTGSHNFVVGPGHSYPEIAGVLLGVENIAFGRYATATGGYRNGAWGDYSSVSGGSANYASGDKSSVCGGENNEALGNFSCISGGKYNDTVGLHSTVSGGYLNIANGNYSSVSGGNARATTSSAYGWAAGALYQDN